MIWLTLILGVISMIIQIVIWLNTKPKAINERTKTALSRLRGHVDKLIVAMDANSIPPADVDQEYIE